MKINSKKIKVFHFLNGKYGGVYSIARNIIRYSENKNLEHHVINILNKDIIPDFLKIEFLDDKYQQVFRYSSSWNFYVTCKKLSKLIPDCNSIIVANDWLELGMISTLGLNNPVVHIIHGNYSYYYELTKKHLNYVNEYIAVNDAIAQNVKIYNAGICMSIKTLLFPVPLEKYFTKNTKTLSILFIAADLKSPNKNLNFIKEINLYLEKYGIDATWHIVGSGYTNFELQLWWGESKSKLRYHGFLTGELLSDVYKQSNIFLLPSNNEGLPVSLIESMINGLVPIINSWENRCSSIVKQGFNGFIVTKNEPLEYVKILIEIHRNLETINILGFNAYNSVINQFNPQKQTEKYEKVLIKAASSINSRKAKKVYGSRLDHPMIPNFITSTYRNLFR